MANQLATSSVLQQPRSYKHMKIASCGKGGRNLFLRSSDDSSSYKKLLVHATQESNCKEAYGAPKSKTSLEDQLKKQKHFSKHQVSLAFHLIRNCWFLQSFKYLMRKVKMTKGSSGKEMSGCMSYGSSQDSSQVDAYFSIPVIPPTNI